MEDVCDALTKIGQRVGLTALQRRSVHATSGAASAPSAEESASAQLPVGAVLLPQPVASTAGGVEADGHDSTDDSQPFSALPALWDKVLSLLADKAHTCEGIPMYKRSGHLKQFALRQFTVLPHSLVYYGSPAGATPNWLANKRTGPIVKKFFTDAEDAVVFEESVRGVVTINGKSKLKWDDGHSNDPTQTCFTLVPTDGKKYLFCGSFADTKRAACCIAQNTGQFTSFNVCQSNLGTTDGSNQHQLSTAPVADSQHDTQP